MSPHADRVLNAHVYYTELSGVGHLAPESVEDVRERLEILERIGCPWWTLEIRDVEGLLKTKRVVEDFLIQRAILPASQRR